jgi:transcriptional regulator with XRE-family HTH domain
MNPVDELRQRHDLTLSELALKSNLSLSTVWALAHGGPRRIPAKLARLADVLDGAGSGVRLASAYVAWRAARIRATDEVAVR